MEDTHHPSPSPESSPKPLSQVKPLRKITPPERKPRHLPSPPASDERKRAASTADELPQYLVDFKRKCDTRGGISQLTSFPLSKDDYTGLRSKLEATFHRFDYYPRRQHITFRMPSATHDTFAQSLVAAIQEELLLYRISNQPEQVRSFIGKIRSSGSSTIVLRDSDDKTDDDTPKLQPDAQFRYQNVAFPSIVVEVAYSQDGKELPSRAKTYIHRTHGGIKAVLCFDINKECDGTISVWKPVFTPTEDDDGLELKITQVVQSQPFRAANGSPVNQDNALVLSLHEFAPDELCGDCPDLPISIPYSKFYEMLIDAEEVEKSATSGIQPNRGVKRSRLSSESVESMTEEDKKKWKAKDRAVKQKLSTQDGEYKGGEAGELSAKRVQETRSCIQPSFVESDSDETVSG
ncbi:hypothetical protein FLAG1_12037 [Fusarium langsethiae]|uniref:Uncharacterized protein n=1 Tax=Fusarium langsethiae TaxID=179993 RepID=A0A0N0V4I1_FUSLA|nr:hypothetical protein FLAG1_12037 [Fusarium langsethiae]GKU09001.1 unnamed protein product [Fusarium langsethiae]GKU15374.1 unnamed protein product [Fusarium langsethiae]